MICFSTTAHSILQYACLLLWQPPWWPTSATWLCTVASCISRSARSARYQVLAYPSRRIWEQSRCDRHRERIYQQGANWRLKGRFWRSIFYSLKRMSIFVNLFFIGRYTKRKLSLTFASTSENSFFLTLLDLLWFLGICMRKKKSATLYLVLVTST